MKTIVAVVGLLFLPRTAAATPQPLPFTYIYETLPKGSLEVEQYADYTPATALSSVGKPVYYGASQFQTEFEYGITDRLELGLYVTFDPTPGNVNLNSVGPRPEQNGIKERLRLRLAEAGQWPVDVGLYGELVENDQEIELEAKIILQRRIGDLRVVANLWGEREFYLGPAQQDWVINPTLGATYQVTPTFHPGIEGWVRAEFPSPAPATRTFNLGPIVYVGPTAMLNFGNFWWSTGIYVRVSDFNRSLQSRSLLAGQQGDVFGSIWARMIIGLSF